MLPTLDGIKGVFASDVKDDHRSDGFLVVDASHVTKALLSSDIPELETDECLGVPLDHLESKVDTDLEDENAEQNKTKQKEKKGNDDVDDDDVVSFLNERPQKEEVEKPKTRRGGLCKGKKERESRRRKRQTVDL